MKKSASGRWRPRAREEPQMGHADVLRLIHHRKVKGRILATFGHAVASLVNMPDRVIIFRDKRSARTRSKIDQRIARCGSGSLVFRPSRTTSRYASHVSNCHASTTCSHSVRRNWSLNLWVPTCSPAARNRSRTTSRGARLGLPKVRLVKALSNGVDRMNLQALRQPWFVADQSPELGAEGIGQNVRERRQQHSRVEIGARQKDGAMQRHNRLPRAGGATETRAGPLYSVPPTGVARDGGTRTTCPTGTRAPVQAPRRWSSRGSGVARRRFTARMDWSPILPE